MRETNPDAPTNLHGDTLSVDDWLATLPEAEPRSVSLLGIDMRVKPFLTLEDAQAIERLDAHDVAGLLRVCLADDSVADDLAERVTDIADRKVPFQRRLEFLTRFGEALMGVSSGESPAPQPSSK